MAKKIIISIIFCLACFFSDLLAQKTHPNIVIILADDQGWGDLGFNGNKTVSTPHIDKLSKEGIILNRFFVSPVCSPTRAEFLTGRSHVRGSVSGTSSGFERLDLDESTIAEAFSKNGYSTGIFGKWHNGGQAPYHPNTRGFNEFYGFCAGHWAEYFNPVLEHNGEIIKGNGFITDDLTTHGISFIEKNKDKPFFAYFPFNTPHSPMQVPDEYWDKYKNKRITQNGTESQKENIEHTKAALAMTENLDWNVGRIMKKLNELNLMENTIIIYFSDNGPNGNRWNGNMKGIKGTTDEGGVRSPFIIKWKNQLAKGKSIDNIAAATDIFPTLVELTGIEYKQTKAFDGLSLKKILLEEKDEQLDNRIIPTYWSGKTSIRSNSFRLTNDNSLYDMRKDPDQTININNEFPDQLNQLLQWKNEWQKNVLSEMPKKDTRPLVVGHPALNLTILPSSEANGKGQVIRSNKHPNSSYFKQWRTSEDEVIWDIEVEKNGLFEVEIYYACSESTVGSEVKLEFNGSNIIGKIITANETPLIGMEHDRFIREESYTKNFIPMKLGNINLTKGQGQLKLSVPILKKQDDFELSVLTLRRIN
jgi:arylsulfatase A-like enzyme